MGISSWIHHWHEYSKYQGTSVAVDLFGPFFLFFLGFSCGDKEGRKGGREGGREEGSEGGREGREASTKT